jgi:phosphoglycerol transferase MdoB-like AlkP superfamily enzyme
MLGKDELDNTVFLIYGDHGNTLAKKGYEEVLNRKLTDIEYRKLLLEVPFILYDPSGKMAKYLLDNNISVDYNRVLSQIDLFQTIKCLYSLNGVEHTLGVNAFSTTKSFAIDPKTLDIITDDFFYSLKNDQYILYNDTSYEEMIERVTLIKEFKLSNDNYLTKKINEKDLR